MSWSKIDDLMHDTGTAQDEVGFVFSTYDTDVILGLCIDHKK